MRLAEKVGGMKLSAELYEAVWQRDRGHCRWPECPLPADETAHLHSKGMGGRPSANSLENLMCACSDHARISDGEYGSGGAEQYRRAHLLLLGPRFLDLPSHLIAWERAEALADVVTRIQP